MTMIQIADSINAVTQDALKDAADRIAMKVAQSDDAVGSDFATVLCMTDAERAACVDQINALLNAAATLQGIAHRDWSVVAIAAADAEMARQA